MDLVERLRFAVAFHSQLCRCLVDEVDGLVGKETVGDVSCRETHGLNDGSILDTDLMMVLIALLQATQDGNGSSLVWLIDHYFLETAFKSLVLLEVFLILVEGSGTHGTQFTTREGWLEDIGSIHCALTTSCTYESMYLIDEEDDLAIGLLYFADHVLQSFLKFAFIHSTCNKCAHIERV